MDHQHQQWRLRPPPIPGTPCPNCSISHFPFCPPPPSFHQNPIFPGNSFQRSGLDPYVRPVGAPAPIPNNGFENPRPTWHSNPNFQGFPPLQPPLPYGGNGFVNEGDRSFKRPRIDGFGPGSGFGAGSFSDDERRLKLIHDHGGGASSDQVLNSEISRDNQNNKNSNRSFVHNEVGNNDRHYSHKNNVNESHHSYMKPHYYNNNNNNNTIHGNQLPQPYGQPSHGGHRPVFRPIGGQPPLPASPPPPLPAYQLHPEAHHSLGQPYYHSKPFSHASTGYVMEEARVFQQTFSKPYVGEGQQFLPKNLDKPKIIDASDLFKQPLRVIRPDHFVVILRGLPGSGKSYLAKMLRDLEVENGGRGPRIHSMDDYFMTEVEKVEEIDASKSSSSARSKKPVMKKVMEYCYEPEMEEAYRMSMLKAFKKTLEDGDFTFVIVDDRNLRVAEFAQFWATAKSSGYEVYILEAPYKDPAGCAARNVHGFTQDDIQKMEGQWEESPSIYLQLDAKSLFHGDDLKESGIQEVDMDTEDTDTDGISGLQETKPVKTLEPPAVDEAPDGSSKNVKSLDAEEDHPTVVMKELGRSKWSEILDDDDTDKSELVKGNNNALSGLIQAYHKEAKSVCWSDQVRDTGFSITAAKKAKVSSLVIGPGAGYNLMSNPLPEEENPAVTPSSAKSKRQNVFQDQLRAEHESFKAVFDRRRHRIGGLGLEDE